MTPLQQDATTRFKRLQEALSTMDVTVRKRTSKGYELRWKNGEKVDVSSIRQIEARLIPPYRLMPHHFSAEPLE